MAWLWATILGAYRLMIIVQFLTMQLIPPDVEPTGDYQSILYDRGESSERKGESGVAKEDGTPSDQDKQT